MEWCTQYRQNGNVQGIMSFQTSRFEVEDRKKREMGQKWRKTQKRFAVLWTPNPVGQAEHQYQMSLETAEPINLSPRLGNDLNTMGYGWYTTQMLWEKKKLHKVALEAALKSIIGAVPHADTQRIDRSKIYSPWLSTMLETIKGTYLSKEEFYDGLKIWYGFTPHYFKFI